MSTLNFRKGFGTRPSNYSEGTGYWEILDKEDIEDICDKLEIFLYKVLTLQSYDRAVEGRPEDPMDFNAPERFLAVLWKAMSDIAPAGTVFGYLADRDSYLGYWPPNKVR